MKLEDKELLLKDLCARFPYGVKVEVKNYRCNGEVRNVEIETLNVEHLTCPIERYRPYLRPMDSMTEEERKIQKGYIYHFSKNSLPDYEGDFVFEDEAHEYIDWLNKKMLDFRGLIDKDLAIEVTEENNPYIR